MILQNQFVSLRANASPRGPADELQAELDTLRQHHALDDAKALAKIWKFFHPNLR